MQFKIHSHYAFNSLGLVYFEIESYKRAILLFRKYLENNVKNRLKINK